MTHYEAAIRADIGLMASKQVASPVASSSCFKRARQAPYPSKEQCPCQLGCGGNPVQKGTVILKTQDHNAMRVGGLEVYVVQTS